MPLSFFHPGNLDPERQLLNPTTQRNNTTMKRAAVSMICCGSSLFASSTTGLLYKLLHSNSDNTITPLSILAIAGLTTGALTTTLGFFLYIASKNTTSEEAHQPQLQV
ncbi:MAG: hypothetical protein AMJ43_05300 [Coxiella sp. DG_40]|nr:MAG: hypothetical protein AMJ43_05300 [Coxiella sp. DG_40]